MRIQNNGDPVPSTKAMASLVAAYRKSGLGLRRFAQEHQIPPGRLHYWVYQKPRNARPRVSAQDRIEEAPPVFQEVQFGVGSPLLESWGAEVRLAGGVSVRFNSAAAPAWISAVIKALQRPC